MKQGFTLIELTIVFIIIGLIIGGILAGRTLIDAAKINSQLEQLSQFDAAVSSFITKFDSIPGDSRVVSPAGCGVGAITETCNKNINQPYYYDGNMATFWVHLNANGFTQDNAVFTSTVTGTVNNNSTTARNLPRAAIDRNAGVAATAGPIANSSTDIMNAYIIADYSSVAPSPASLPAAAKAVFTTAQAQAIDTKIDDGQPYGGFVRSVTMANAGEPTLGLDGGNAYTPSSGSAKTIGLKIQIMLSSGGIPNRSTSY